MGAAANTIEEPPSRLHDECPFVGLRPFNTLDSPWFFGRNDQAYDLLRRLNGTHFLAVVGPSGCGKSSLVRAGVLAALQDGYLAGEGEWTIVTMEPKNDPLAEWKRNLEPHLRKDASPDSLLTDPSAVLDTSTGPIVIVIDQFEDLFKYGERYQRIAEVEKFISAMLATAAEDAKIFTVVTMRSEFIEQCGTFPALAEAMNEGLYLLPRMTREQLRTAVVGPLQKASATITVQLIDRLLDDTSREADGLPILQHSLAQLWPKRKPFEPMGMDVYPRDGGLGDFIDKHAEDVYRRIDPQGKTTELLFRAIVEVSDSGLTLRRPLIFNEIVAQTGADPAQLEVVVKEFRQEGFLRAAETGAASNELIDLTHEAIARQWKSYVGWIAKEDKARRAVREIRQAAAAYWSAEPKHRTDYLGFQGRHLADLESRLGDAKQRLSEEQQQFLSKCHWISLWNRIFSQKMVLSALVALAALAVFGRIFFVVYQDNARAALVQSKLAAETARLVADAAKEKVKRLQAQNDANSALQSALRLVPAVLPAKSSPKLYPQIWNQDQKGVVLNIEKALTGTGILLGATEIVNVGPLSDEVRYFFKDDRPQAEEIVAKIVPLGLTTKKPTYVPGFDTKIRHGHFELWLKRPN